MVDLGLSKDDEPTSFTKEELVKYFRSEVLSCTMCSRSMFD